MAISEASNEEYAEDSQEGMFLTFVLGDEVYGIEIRYVMEIIGIQKITMVPEMPSYVKGVINLRGKVIPVLDVRLRFSMTPRNYDERTCIIVIKAKETTVGLIVDTVSEVLEIPEEQIQLSHHIHQTDGSQFMKGLGKVGDEVKILLDAEKLLFQDEKFTDREMVGSEEARVSESG